VTEITGDQAATTERVETRPLGSRLFRKYVTLFVFTVGIAVVANGFLTFWASYRDNQASLVRIQREQAASAAGKIGQFVKEIEHQLAWTTQLPVTNNPAAERINEAFRLLQLVPAITDIAWIDSSGLEQVRVSRLSDSYDGNKSPDRPLDLSHDPKFVEAVEHKVYYGPVYFRRDTEPYMTLAVAGTKPGSGVGVAEVNLKFIGDVVSQIKVGEHGQAYAVDSSGRLIAHPNLELVLRNTDLSNLAQVQAARARGVGAAPQEARVAEDMSGRQVLTANAAITPLGWLVFVELPIEEAYAPLYASLSVSGLLLLASLAVAGFASLVLARNMVRPIQLLQSGAARIGAGALDHRIAIDTGDELEALGDQLNSMAARLHESYANLEGKVIGRTRELELANLAKSRFLAAASHDLRQPLHALSLFVAQLDAAGDPAERRRIVSRIDAAVLAMNELFNALLDISKLDAGAWVPDLTIFPLDPLLARLESNFGAVARGKGLTLRVLPSNAWVRSDRVLLERVLLNLVSNAVRYTSRGGILIGCRRRGTVLRIEVWDSGAGIPDDQQQNIFGEFYRLAKAEEQGAAGLGLGLAIVDRSCRLLDHPLDLTSRVGKGSRFSVTVPLALPRLATVETPAPQDIARAAFTGKLVVVIDDDPLVLEGMGGLLRSWGCRVVLSTSSAPALAELVSQSEQPDLIVSDYHLPGETGITVIEHLRSAFKAPIPAFLVSGDTLPERKREAEAAGLHLLQKPVPPMTLRAMLNGFLKS
jgi:signal transduction histidine kinase/CheY-like chemotaxis protein